MGVGREQLQDCILNPYSQQLPLKHCQEIFQIFADLVQPGGKKTIEKASTDVEAATVTPPVG